MEFQGFDWDDANTLKSLKKHGVSQNTIEEFFHKPFWTGPDPRHSTIEERFIAVGRGESGRPMFVVFTFRMKEGLKLLRPISARYMHAKEVMRYEKEFAKIEKR